MLNVSRADYLFFSENFSLKYTYQAERPYLKDVPLQPIKAGNRIVLRNIFFEIDSYALRKESAAELNKLLRFLQLNPGVNIEISGHTDNTGNPEYNQKLSENRAKSVTDFLIQAKVDPQRIISRGYGLTRPIAPNDTEEGRALNRRTEMQIIE
jgi:outer membrane protein OmpA-like peptidoglycan-associated protein